MALPTSIVTREYNKFVEDTNGDVAVRISLSALADSAIVAEDSALSNGGPLMIVGGIRQDTPIEDTTADGDAGRLKFSNIGALWVQQATVPGYEDDARSRALTASPAVVTEAYNVTPYAFTGATATAAVVAAPGALTGFALTNTGATFLWVIFNDDDNGITGADAAELSFPLPPNSSITINSSFFPAGQHGFGTGISIGISTTQATYTAHATPSDVKGIVMYK